MRGDQNYFLCGAAIGGFKTHTKRHGGQLCEAMRVRARSALVVVEGRVAMQSFVLLMHPPYQHIMRVRWFISLGVGVLRATA